MGDWEITLLRWGAKVGAMLLHTVLHAAVEVACACCGREGEVEVGRVTVGVGRGGAPV